MADLQHMSRILYHHDWTNVEDWARNIAELADLTDDEIQELERCPTNAPARERVASVTSPPRPVSLAARARQSLHSLRGAFRFGLRRAY